MSKSHKNQRKNLKGKGPSFTNQETSVQEEINAPENDSAILDESLFTIPTSVLSDQNSTINTEQCRLILDIIKKQENVILASPKKATADIQKFLNFHMNLLELFPKVGSRNPTSPSSESVKPTTGYKPTDDGRDIQAVPYKLSLSSDELLLLKESCLGLLTHLVKSTKKSRVFSYWYAFLPDASSNPFKLGIFDLLDHSHEGIRLSVLGLVQTFFNNSSTYLLLANYHCRSSSFTPVCYEFAISLGKLVIAVTNAFQYGSPTVATAVAKTLVVLLEQVPFHRLQTGILNSISDKLLRLKLEANPVIQIAVLQVCSSLISIDHTQSSVSQEIRAVFQDFFKMFLVRSFPNLVSSTSHGTPTATNLIDSNIRYVSIQCLAKLAQLDIGLFMQNVDSSLLKVFEEVLRSEKDTSLCLHLLRLIKGIGTCGPKSKNDVNVKPWILDKLVHFWSSFFIRSTIFDYIERRTEAILQAALCDCLSEVGEVVFSLLPTDRRMLCVTYLLRKSYMEEDTDSRVVVTSQVRGIGMLVSWPSCYSDSAILVDSAEILLDVLGRDKDSPIHKNVALSGSWALANLVDALARQSKSSSMGSVSKTDYGNIEEVSNLHGDLEFPPHLTLQLAKVAIRYASNIHNLMNIRANCCRCLGALIRCLDGIACEQVEDPSLITENVEFRSVTLSIVDAIILNVSTGKAMKVRWNACYAAGGVFKPTNIFEDKELISRRALLIETMLPIVEKFPNFKVRISAAFALGCVETRSIFGEKFQEICLTLVRALDTVHDVTEEEEAQHRSDLVDQLCLTFCHLLSLAETKDLDRLNRTLNDQYSTDNLEYSLRTVAMRISPEKASTIICVKRKLLEKLEANPIKTKYPDDGNYLLDLFSNLDSLSFIDVNN